MKSTKDPKEVVVEESSARVFKEGVTGRSRDKERCRLEILRTNDSTTARVVEYERGRQRRRGGLEPVGGTRRKERRKAQGEDCL